MSSPSPDAVRDELVTRGAQYAASTTAWLSGTEGFSQIRVTGLPTTTSTFLDIDGRSTLSSGAKSMQVSLVAAAGATTFTTTGYVRVTVTDAAGNITNGDHYIAIGTLT